MSKSGIFDLDGLADDIRKAAKDMARDHVSASTFEVKCPHCGAQVNIPKGKSICEHCKNEIDLKLNINF